ncbi:uncharacterized protein LOC127808906 [Diospyros lotus]|uniref:uncharacterized protein LOC127808906 n=1 Tax=Diospyros lotus TaxID=55363 RepID=UPI00224E602A|nr:uncharacterized protein LOC127808906 [Diospyros lotus]
MARMPVRFKRVAEAFDEVALARARLHESRGGENSPSETAIDLSDLVKSFMERESGVDGERDDVQEREGNRSQFQSHCSDSELKQTLAGLLGLEGDDEVKKHIHAEIEDAFRDAIGEGSSPEGFKRRLVSRLRERGFDAGLCKSKWERNGRIPSGSYEFIDVNVAGTRYIIEVCLAGEFKIARPTHSYASALQVLPPIFVGKADELKRVVTLMCNAMKDSMKSMEMHVPPWRRLSYMQAKWFGSYKRTINEASPVKVSDSDAGFAGKRSVGFAPLPGVSCHCRDDFASKIGLKVNGNAVVR